MERTSLARVRWDEGQWMRRVGGGQGGGGGDSRACLDRLVREMLDACPPIDDEQTRVVDVLGGGAAMLSAPFVQAFPVCHLTLIEMSADRLALSKQRLAAIGAPAPRTYHVQSAPFLASSSSPLPGEPYDLILCALGLYRARSEAAAAAVVPTARARTDEAGATARAGLSQNMHALFSSLHPGGWLVLGECATDELPLRAHWNSLVHAGFDNVDCTWRQGDLFVLVAQRRSSGGVASSVSSASTLSASSASSSSTTTTPATHLPLTSSERSHNRLDHVQHEWPIMRPERSSHEHMSRVPIAEGARYTRGDPDVHGTVASELAEYSDMLSHADLGDPSHFHALIRQAERKIELERASAAATAEATSSTTTTTAHRPRRRLNDRFHAADGTLNTLGSAAVSAVFRRFDRSRSSSLRLEDVENLVAAVRPTAAHPSYEDERKSARIGGHGDDDEDSYDSFWIFQSYSSPDPTTGVSGIDEATLAQLYGPDGEWCLADHVAVLGIQL